MTLAETSETYSWKAALDLGPALLSLADELPATETMGLGLHLHQLAVELPAGIAADLLAGKSADMSVMLKLITALELIDRIYPALDAAPVRRQADELAARLTSDGFGDRPQPEVPAEPEPDADSESDSETPAGASSAPQAAPDLAGTPLLMSDVTAVPVQAPAATEETNVLPNSLQ